MHVLCIYFALRNTPKETLLTTDSKLKRNSLKTKKMHTPETHKYQCRPKILQWVLNFLMDNQIPSFISGSTLHHGDPGNWYPRGNSKLLVLYTNYWSMYPLNDMDAQ